MKYIASGIVFMFLILGGLYVFTEDVKVTPPTQPTASEFDNQYKSLKVN